MKKKILLLPVMGLSLMMLACQGSAPEPTPLSEADLAAVKQGIQAWEKAFLARDWDSLAKLYTKDAVYMPEQQTVKTGHVEIKADFATFPPVASMTVTPLDIEGRGDLAFVRGAFSGTMTPKDADPMTMVGKYIEIWRKQADGTWLISHDIWNSDNPPTDKSAQP